MITDKTITQMEFDEQPVSLFDEWVILRPLSEDDLSGLYLVAADPLIWEQHPKNDRWKRDVFERFFYKALESKTAFIISDRKSGDVIGSSRYYDIDKEPDTVAIGYTFLARQYWGGAYNRSVKHLMLVHAFKFFSRVVFHVAVDNIRSQKAIEKLGAVRYKELPPDEDSDHARYEYLMEKQQFIS